MIRALLFDFDGLILETEKPIYQSWSELFAKYGTTLPLSLWQTIIGTDNEPFDPWQMLKAQAQAPFDRTVESRWRRQREFELVEAQTVMPGIENILSEARQLKLKMAVVSSSSQSWVKGHLDRLHLTQFFHLLVTRESVAQSKPEPDLYLKALEDLKISPHEAVVFEDSLNGVRAARAAGIYTVAVPTEMTNSLDFSEANLIIGSLAGLSLPDLFSKAASSARSG